MKCSKCGTEMPTPTSVNIEIEGNLRKTHQNFKCSCGRLSYRTTQTPIQKLVAVGQETHQALYHNTAMVVTKETIPVVFVIQCPLCEEFEVSNVSTQHIHTKCGHPIYFKETYKCDVCKKTFTKIKFPNPTAEQLFLEMIATLSDVEQKKYKGMICRLG